MNNNRSIFKKDWNITGLARISYIVVAALIVIGIVLLSVPKIRLNTGVDFSNSYAIDITYGSDFDYSGEVAKIRSVLSNKVKDEEGKAYPSVGVIKHQQQGTPTTGYSIRVYYKAIGGKDMDTANKDIVNALKGDLIDDEAPYRVNVSDAVEVSRFKTVESVLRPVSAMIVALVAAMIYIMFRHKLANSLVTFVMLAVDIMLLLTLTAITRATVNFPFLGVVAFAMCLSLINSVIIFARFKEHRKNPSNANKSTAKLINQTAKETFMPLALTAAVVALGAVALIIASLIGGGAYVGLGLTIVFAAVVTFATGVFVTPSVFVAFNDFGKAKLKATKPKAKKPNTKSTEKN